MRNLLKVAGFAWVLCATGVAAEDRFGPEAIDDFDGLSFGQSAQSVDWLTPASWMGSGCSRETFYYASHPARRNRLADVQLVWPGLLYRFFDNRLYAIEADLPRGEDGFAKLQIYLTALFGRPSMSESWQGAPVDTFVYQYRLRSAGWYGPDGKRSIWLTSHDAGGTLILIDNSLIDLGGLEIDKVCTAQEVSLAASAVGSSAGVADRD
jgi:hypothetical protein